MSRDDIRKLLGGYATGTLTPEEEQALFAAALDDQDLFDTLAREQSLRDLLRDPAAKAELLAALDTRPSPWLVWWRPAAAVLAMAGIAVFAVVSMRPPAVLKLAVTVAPPDLQSSEVAPSARHAEVATPAPQRSDASPPQTAQTSTRELRRTAMDQLRAAKAAPPENEEAALKRKDAVGYQAGAGSAGAIGGVVGGIPAAAPSVAPPPPPVLAISPAPPPPPERAAKQSTESVLVFADAGAGPRARELFLGSRVVQPTQVVVSSYMEQQQKVNQSPSPPQQETDLQKARQESAFMKSLQPAPAPLPGVRYEELRAGEAVSLRLETNTPGYLYTWSRRDGGPWRPLVSFTVEAMKPYTTPALQPGENEVYVWFSRTRQMAMSAPAPPALGGQSITNAVERTGAATYVVNPVPVAPAPQVRFTIRLP